MLFPTVGWIARSRNGRTLWVRPRPAAPLPSPTLTTYSRSRPQPIFTRPLRALVPYLSYLVRPILPLTTFPAPTLALLRSPRTIAHALGLARTEMDTIRAPDLAYFARASASTSTSKAGGAGDVGDASDAGGVHVYGIWSAGRLDKWVGEEGPQVQLALGGEEGGRVKILQGVPHAFCLCKFFFLTKRKKATYLEASTIEPELTRAAKTHSHNVAGVLANWIDPSSTLR